MHTIQDWANYDRLVKELREMPESRFDYGNGYYSGAPDCACCVAAHVIRLQGERGASDKGAVLIDFLGITAEHAKCLWYPCYYDDVENGDFGRDQHGLSQRGHATKADALRRLAVLATLYTRPDTATNVPTWQPDDAAFIAACRALVREPVMSGEEA
jgi:hypothetical protein